ncbi:hypothetical protein I7I53_07050 [Histoplasma capsulatum var. duboisii H88]|uniref:Uncharacterized protein n=1 Tax=Ajellomyces capsulatus (strain H88) TaxID=544711 RepID=A0A8A1LD21_AJEC8|nr:hypothetical protein I7I53_07050 [Histoplasma capsulatum var. duboisii H88]
MHHHLPGNIVTASCCNWYHCPSAISKPDQLTYPSLSLSLCLSRLTG